MKQCKYPKYQSVTLQTHCWAPLHYIADPLLCSVTLQTHHWVILFYRPTTVLFYTADPPLDSLTLHTHYYALLHCIPTTGPCYTADPLLGSVTLQPTARLSYIAPPNERTNKHQCYYPWHLPMRVCHSASVVCHACLDLLRLQLSMSLHAVHSVCACFFPQSKNMWQTGHHVCTCVWTCVCACVCLCTAVLSSVPLSCVLCLPI